jgi:hypothetical protein
MLRPSRSIWATLVFLLGFTLLIILVSHYFLLPAILASRDATAQEKQHIQAVATLVLTIVLFILGVGLVLTLRVKRFFLTPAPRTRTKTEYSDAWAEAGKRAKLSEDDEP